MFKSALQEIFYVFHLILSCKKLIFSYRFPCNSHTFKVKYLGTGVAKTRVILACQTATILQNKLRLQYPTVSWYFQQQAAERKLESYNNQTCVIGE